MAGARGWLHYLAFDLLTGTWEARDSVSRGVPRWLLVPCLFLTLMFGPMGWGAYMLVRLRFGGEWCCLTYGARGYPPERGSVE